MDNEWPSPWPETFVSRMSAWLGDETDAFLTALRKRDYGLRLNPRRAPISVLQADLPWQARPVPWCPEGMWLDEETVDQGEPLGRHPYHTAGVYYIQDPSAMAAAVLLDPKPGEWVLDLAAAPGSKATHLAARMENEGVLVTNDVSRGRASILAMNLERMGVTNALVTNAYPEQLREAWAGLFDAMLVDAPCSGEGTFSRDPRALQDWSLETVRTYAARQVNILDQAAPLVRRGGQILYGTCTFSPEENEGVIAEFLAAHPDFELMELPMLPTMDRGHPEWIGAPEELRKAGRFWPHRGPGHGHFYALLRRTGAPPEELPARWTENAMPGRVLHRYLDTLGRILVEDPPQEGLILTPDDHCYITPMAPSLWANVSVMRPGWWVASLRHNKIFPDHALAMALHPREVKAHISLDPDDQHLDQYLDGSSWPDEGPAGYLLITVDGYPLGWAKRAGGKLRSRYPVHLRRRRALP